MASQHMAQSEHVPATGVMLFRSIGGSIGVALFGAVFKEPGPWITELKKRRPTGVAIVAM